MQLEKASVLFRALLSRTGLTLGSLASLSWRSRWYFARSLDVQFLLCSRAGLFQAQCASTCSCSAPSHCRLSVPIQSTSGGFSRTLLSLLALSLSPLTTDHSIVAPLPSSRSKEPEPVDSRRLNGISVDSVASINKVSGPLTGSGL